MNDDLAKYIGDIKTQIVDFKSTQSIGSKSIKVFKTQTSNDWDAIWTRPNPFTVNSVSVFRFIPDNQDAPFISIRVYAQVNGFDFDPMFADRSAVEIMSNLGNVVTLRSNPITFGVSLQGGNQAGDTTRIKITVLGTDTGRIEKVES